MNLLPVINPKVKDTYNVRDYVPIKRENISKIYF